MPSVRGAFLAHAAVPRWLAWLTLAGVLFALLDAVSSSGSPLEPVEILGLAYFLVWSLATGATLLRPATADTDASRR